MFVALSLGDLNLERTLPGEKCTAIAAKVDLPLWDQIRQTPQNDRAEASNLIPKNIWRFDISDKTGRSINVIITIDTISRLKINISDSYPQSSLMCQLICYIIEV